MSGFRLVVEEDGGFNEDEGVGFAMLSRLGFLGNSGAVKFIDNDLSIMVYRGKKIVGKLEFRKYII